MAVAQSPSQPGAGNGRPSKRFWAQAGGFLRVALEIVGVVLAVAVGLTVIVLAGLAWIRGLIWLTDNYLPWLLPDAPSNSNVPPTECFDVGGLRRTLPLDLPAETRFYVAQQHLSDKLLRSKPICKGVAGYMKELQLEAEKERERLTDQVCHDLTDSHTHGGWGFWL